MDDEDELPPWARRHDDEEPVPRRRRRRWVLMAAVVPWTLVLALVAVTLLRAPAPGTSSTDDPAARTADGAARQWDHQADDVDETRAASDTEADADLAQTPPAEASDHHPSDRPAEAPLTGESPATPPPIPDGSEDLATATVGAVALTVARAWLTDVGPRLEIDGVEPVPDRYLEHAVVERIDRHGDHAVVAVLAVVLTRDGDQYVDAQPQRLAVPVRLTHPPRPAGPPWWLDDVALVPAEPEPSPTITDPDELVTLAEALGAAGIDDELVAASRTGDGWWIAELDAGQRVWLLPGPTGPVVAGANGRTTGDGGDGHADGDDEEGR